MFPVIVGHVLLYGFSISWVCQRCALFFSGVRLSYNNPRPKDVGSSKHSAGDGMYDIALADKVVMRTAPR